MSEKNRKTTEELKASGGYRKDRHGNRADVSPAPGEPIRPEGMTPGQAQIWDSVLASLPAAAIGEKDESAMVELIETYQRMRDVGALLAENRTDKDNRIAYCAFFDRWLKLAQEFGLTPRSRAAIKVPTGGEQDEETDTFAELMSRYESVN